MADVTSIDIEISVLLGVKQMPVHQLLRMGRGAVIGLDAHEDDAVKILANNVPVAEGQVVINNDVVSISVTRILPRPASMRDFSTTDPV